MKLPKCFSIVIIAISVSQRFDGTRGNFTLKDLAASIEAEDNEQSPDRSKLDHLPVEIYVDDRLMREAFEIINRYLDKTVKTVDLVPNIQEVRSLIGYERRYANEPVVSPCGWLKKRSCLSQQLKSKESDQMINALLKIVQLERTNRPDTECDVATTRIIMDSNKWAGDPIGRRLRGQTDTMGHIDRLIFATAYRRAVDCLPRYKTEFKHKESLYGHAWMKIYWNRILDHRFKKMNSESCEREIMAESIFRMSPEDSIELIRKMPSSLERDEVGITLRMFDDATAKSNVMYHRGEIDKRLDKFETLLLKPCSTYVDAMRKLFESLDFDMRLKNVLPQKIVASIESYDLIVRQRAYYLLCQKLIQDKRKYKHLLVSA